MGAKSVEFTTRTGEVFSQDYPDNWSDERVDADLAQIGAKRYESWGGWVQRHVVPQTPVEWAIFAATLPFGFGAGGAAAKLGQVGGKTVAGMVARRLATGKLAQVGLTTAAGAAGAGYEQLTAEEPEQATTLGQGAFQGFISGLAGQAATGLMSSMTKIWMRRITERYKDPAALNAWMREYLPELAPHIKSGNTVELFKALQNHEIHEAARAQLKTAIKDAEGLASQKYMQLPELQTYLQRMERTTKLPDYPPAPGGIFSVEQAMDYLTGAELNEHLYRVTFDRIQAQVGKKAADRLEEGLGRYGFFKEVQRLFGNRADEIWAGGKLNLNPVREDLMKIAGEAGLQSRRKLGDSLDSLLETVYRGDIPAVFDRPAKLGIGGVSGGGRVYFTRPSLGSRAGSPGALPPGMLSPLTAVPGAQVGASLEEFIPGQSP